MKIQPVTDEEIAAAFRGTNFGAADHRRLLALSVMKKALRFHCGHTITEIMVELQLTTRKRGMVNRSRPALRVSGAGRRAERVNEPRR